MTRSVEITQPSTAKRIHATRGLIDREKSDSVRRVWDHLDPDLRAAVSETHGAKIAATANDLTGRPADSLTTAQLVREDSGTIRNWGAEYEDALLTGDAVKAQQMKDTATDALHDIQLQSDISPEKRKHLEWVASGGTAGPRPDLDVDYHGLKPGEVGYVADPTGRPQTYRKK